MQEAQSPGAGTAAGFQLEFRQALRRSVHDSNQSVCRHSSCADVPRSFSYLTWH